MITDALLAPLLTVAGWVVGLLPDADTLTLPGLEAALTWLARANSIVPIGGIIAVGLAVLSYVLVFITVRAVLTIWHIVWP